MTEPLTICVPPPNLNTVYPDILRAILEFLNPYYSRVLRMTFKGAIPNILADKYYNTTTSLRYDHSIKFRKKIIFYQFAEDYAEHPDFRKLFPSIKFHKLALYGCIDLHKKFVITQARSDWDILRICGIVDNRLFNHPRCFDSILYDVAKNRGFKYFLEAWQKTNRCAIPAIIIPYFNAQQIEMIMKLEPKLNWKFMYIYKMFDNDLLQEDKISVFFQFWQKYGRQTGLFDKVNQKYIIEWLIRCKYISEFIKYINEVGKDILKNFEINSFINNYASLEFCEWIYANVDKKIFENANNCANNNFEVQKRCLELGIKLKYVCVHNCEQIRQLVAAGYAVENIISKFAQLKLNVDDLKWAKEAGYSMSGVLYSVLRSASNYNYDTTAPLQCGKFAPLRCGTKLFDEMVSWAYENDSAIDWQEVFDAICCIGYTKFIPEIQCAIKRGENIRVKISPIKNMEFIKWLVEANLLTTNHEDILIYHLLEKPDFESLKNVKWMYEKGFALSDDLIRYACELGEIEYVKWLVAHGIDLSRDFVGHAVYNGHINILQYALNCGITFNVKNFLKKVDDHQYNYCRYIDIDNYALLKSIADLSAPSCECDANAHCECGALAHCECNKI